MQWVCLMLKTHFVKKKKSVPVLRKVMTNLTWYFSFSCLSSLFPIMWMVPASLSRRCQAKEKAQKETPLSNSNKALRIGFLMRNNTSSLSGESASSGHWSDRLLYLNKILKHKQNTNEKQILGKMGYIIHLDYRS